MPAYLEGMRLHAAEIRAIADRTDAPTFDNTIVAMERAGATLGRVQYVFGNLAQALTDATMQKIEADVAPLLARHNDDIHLDPKLFARVHALYEKRATLGLDAVDTRLLERYHLDFVRSGAQLGGGRQDGAARPQRGGVVAPGQVFQAPDQGHERQRDRRRSRRGARRHVGRRRRRRRRRRERARPEGQVGDPAGQHHHPAGARVALQPGPPRAHLPRLDRARAPRRRDRPALARRPPRPAPRPARQAPRLHQRRQLPPRRPDGEVARGRDEAARRDRPRGRRPRPHRGGRAPGRGRRPARRLQAGAVGLAVLFGAGPQGEVRARRQPDPALLRAGARPEGRRLLRRSPDVRRDLQAPHRSARLPPRRARLGGVRRRRQQHRSPLHRLLRAREQARRRVDEQLQRSERAPRRETRSSSTSSTSPSPPRASRRCSPSTR